MKVDIWTHRQSADTFKSCFYVSSVDCICIIYIFYHFVIILHQYQTRKAFASEFFRNLKEICFVLLFTRSSFSTIYSKKKFVLEFLQILKCLFRDLETIWDRFWPFFVSWYLLLFFVYTLTLFAMFCCESDWSTQLSWQCVAFVLFISQQNVILLNRFIASETFIYHIVSDLLLLCFI